MQNKHVFCIVLCGLFNLHCTLQYCAVCSKNPTLFRALCIVCSVQCTVYSVQCTLYTVHCTLYSVQCTVFSEDTAGDRISP